jgi:hypothetical protein
MPSRSLPPPASLSDCGSRDFTLTGWLWAPAPRVVVVAVGRVLSWANVEAIAQDAQLGPRTRRPFPSISRSLNVAGERLGKHTSWRSVFTLTG